MLSYQDGTIERGETQSENQSLSVPREAIRLLEEINSGARKCYIGMILMGIILLGSTLFIRINLLSTFSCLLVALGFYSLSKHRLRAATEMKRLLSCEGKVVQLEILKYYFDTEDDRDHCVIRFKSIAAAGKSGWWNVFLGMPITLAIGPLRENKFLEGGLWYEKETGIPLVLEFNSLYERIEHSARDSLL